MANPNDKVNNKTGGGGSFQYPLDSSDANKSSQGKGSRLGDQDFIKFERMSKPTPSGGGDVESKIKLFVPPQSLNYARSYTYTEEEQTFVSANETIKNLANSNKGVISKLFGSIGAGFADAKRAGIATAFGSQAFSQAAGKFGFAFNPNMEIYFKQPNFRTFEFTFPFLPKNPKESQQIEKIVYEFEKYSMPLINKSSGGYGKNIYEYPKVWMISTRARVSAGFNSKSCVLETFDVNYGADAGYTTFVDGRPVMTTLKLTFKEIELWDQSMI